MRVLLFEDSQTLHRTITRALKHAGYAVDSAGDGEEGAMLADVNSTLLLGKQFQDEPIEGWANANYQLIIL